MGEKQPELNEEYIKMVENFANSDSDIVFGNNSLDHAVVIAKNMFKKANSDIEILSGTLDEMYFSQIEPSLKEVAERLKLKDEGVIKIITVQEEFPEKLKKKFENMNLEIGKDVFKYLPLLNPGKPEDVTHFYVIDGKRWRVEEPHGEIREGKVKAQVCFNDEHAGENFHKYFDDLWNHYSNENAV